MASILADGNSTTPNSMLLLVAGGIGGLALGGTIIVCCVVCLWREKKGSGAGEGQGGGHAEEEEEAKGEPIVAQDDDRPKSNMLDDLATLIHLDPLPPVVQQPKGRAVAPRPQRPSDAAELAAFLSLVERRATQRSCQVCQVTLDDLTVYRDLALGGASEMSMDDIKKRIDREMCTPCYDAIGATYVSALTSVHNRRPGTCEGCAVLLTAVNRCSRTVCRACVRAGYR